MWKIPLLLAVRSTSWRGAESESSANSDTGGAPPPRLERSKSTQGNMSNREHQLDGVSSNLNRKFAALNANASWDDDNLPEWYDD